MYIELQKNIHFMLLFYLFIFFIPLFDILLYIIALYRLYALMYIHMYYVVVSQVEKLISLLGRGIHHVLFFVSTENVQHVVC